SAAGRFRRTDGGAAQDPPPGRGNAPAAAGRATPYPPRQPLAGSLAPGSSPHSSHTAARPILAGGSTAAPRLLPISFAFSAALGPHRLDQWRGRLKRRSQDVPQLRLRGRGLERRLGAERRRLKGRHRLDQLLHLLRPEDVPLGCLKDLHRSSRPPVPALDREPIGGIGRSFSPFHGPSGAKNVHVQILPLAREPEILEVNPRPEPDPILRGIGPTDQPVVPVPAPEVDTVRASPGLQQATARPALRAQRLPPPRAPCPPRRPPRATHPPRARPAPRARPRHKVHRPPHLRVGCRARYPRGARPRASSPVGPRSPRGSPGAPPPA